MNRSPEALWEVALGQLQLQVPRPNYQTWLRDSAGLALEDGPFTVRVPPEQAAKLSALRAEKFLLDGDNGPAGWSLSAKDPKC